MARDMAQRQCANAIGPEIFNAFACFRAVSKMAQPFPEWQGKALVLSYTVGRIGCS